jgi:hypothetical protein
MALEDEKVVFDIFESLVTKYGLTCMPFILEPTLEVISPVHSRRWSISEWGSRYD